MKVKNMIYLTISYIPWIVYWSISAELKPYGGIAALILELILILYGKISNKFSFMDLFSVLYFITTIIANYIFKTDYLIVGDGYFGYAALLSMSLISMLMKRPFMGYYVEKDWKNYNLTKSKIDKLSIFQTKVWTVVFFIDIWVFVFINTAVAAVIISNVFVLIGIILSIHNENILKDA
ncbi:all-trans-retinol 13,14-reductase [Clostridium sp. DSM 8431]|uniref:hypothetical protein n=1 Tax=Clostridium sp. DSM 8431 TaxID=1761781 RepID=UPI0008E54243|nr:hypothetical protein [Clostridium sp. DSM 8431]SFU76092.1 all-trans-retinol 13,14-reductase [Clostridium sp. DSM 8431]